MGLGAGQNTFDLNARSLISNGSLSAIAGGSAIDKQTFILAAEVADVKGGVTLRTSTTSGTDFEIGALENHSLRISGGLSLISTSCDDKVMLAGRIETFGSLNMNLVHGSNSVLSANTALIKANVLTYTGGSQEDSVSVLKFLPSTVFLMALCRSILELGMISLPMDLRQQ